MVNRVSKKIIIWGIVAVIVVGGGYFGYTYYMNYKSGKFEAKKNLEKMEDIVTEINSEKKEDVQAGQQKLAEFTSEAELYDAMHRMANTKIIAEDNKIWGELPIDEESLSIVRSFIEVSNYKDKNKLLDIVGRWEIGDFSQAAEEHNYFWGKLGGTIGEAIGVKEEYIKSTGN